MRPESVTKKRRGLGQLGLTSIQGFWGIIVNRYTGREGKRTLHGRGIDGFFSFSFLDLETQFLKNHFWKTSETFPSNKK